MVLLGSRHSGSTQHIREFLSRNGQPFTYQDVETDPSVQALLDRFHVGVDEVPVVVCHGGHVLKNPSIEMLSSALGLSAELDAARGARRGDRRRRAGGAGRGGLRRVRGAGRAGAREHGARRAGGHQLAHRELPGLSHRHLRAGAGRARAHAGGEVRRRGGHRPHASSASTATAGPIALHLSDGQVVRTRAIVIATGVQYRKLELPSLARFEGAGVYYCATHLEGQLCAGEEVAVVGGGNSAGQAAVFLAGVATRVHMLVRGPGLAESMSRYLIQRIENTPNIVAAHAHADRGARGRRTASSACGGGTSTPASARRATIRNLFLMTGADPNTALARGLPGPRRQEVREDRRRPAPRGSRRRPLAAAPPPVPAWRPASPACSASATRARPASSAWPPRSARARSASSSSTARCRSSESSPTGGEATERNLPPSPVLGRGPGRGQAA